MSASLSPSSALSKFYKNILSSEDHRILRKNNFIVKFTSTLSGTSSSFNNALDKLTELVQSIKQMPSFKIESDKGDDVFEVHTFLGSFTGITTDSIIKSDSNRIIFSFLDTEYLIFERFFLPWMETIIYGFNGVSQIQKEYYPFLRVNIDIDLLKGNIPIDTLTSYNEKNILITYRFFGAYPVFIDTPDLAYGASSGAEATREVTFAFNNMSIKFGDKKTLFTNM